MEKLSLSQLQQLTLHSFSSEGELVAAIKSLSENFTQKKNFSQYPLSPQLVSAYTLFYLPTNFPKLEFIFSLLPPDLVAELVTCDLIDIGTGPGTFLLAFLQLAGPKYSGKILGIDHSPLMLESAKRLLNYYFPHFGSYQLRESIPFNEIKDGKKLLLSGHALNEMGVRNMLELVKKVSPPFILFIEPGTPEIFKMILELGESLRQEGYDNLFPCPRPTDACPLEKNFAGDVLPESPNWCHQVLHMVHPPEWERLSQKVRKDRRRMPLIAHLFAKKSTTSAQKFKGREEDKTLVRGRLLRILQETKHSFDLEICQEADGGGHEIICGEYSKRHLSKTQIKAWREVDDGISLKFRRGKCLDSNQKKFQVEVFI